MLCRMEFGCTMDRAERYHTEPLNKDDVNVGVNYLFLGVKVYINACISF